MSMSFLAVLPVVWEQTAIPCLASMVDERSSLGLKRREILVVDNTRHGYSVAPAGVELYRDPDGHNLGVAGSWNVGARRVLEQGLDWLVIVSTSMLFGPDLHTTFRQQVERHPDAQIVESTGNSWHLIAIARSTLATVGLFDENFYPAYEESIDWGYRQRLLGLEQQGWPREWSNCMSVGYAMHVDRAAWDAPSCPAGPLQTYYEQKWGGPKGHERFVHPWDNPDLPLDYWPVYTVPEMAERYGLEVWW